MNISYTFVIIIASLILLYIFNFIRKFKLLIRFRKELQEGWEVKFYNSGKKNYGIGKINSFWGDNAYIIDNSTGETLLIFKGHIYPLHNIKAYLNKTLNN